MTRPTKLDDDIIDQQLAKLPNWSLSDSKLHREFKFDTFASAFAFMTKIAAEAEKMNHHPELYNVYNKVEVDLSTHDCDGISQLDFDLAEKIEKHVP